MIYTQQYTNINGRSTNEDSSLAYSIKIKHNENYNILLLSDGMGGHDHGDIISNTTISVISDFINKKLLNFYIQPSMNNKNISLELQKTVLDSIEFTNLKINQMIKNNNWKGGGATLVVVIVFNGYFYWGILGDSRLYHYVFDKNTVSQIGFDHNVPGILENEGVITRQVAKYHSKRNQLVYYIGGKKFPKLKEIKSSGKIKLSQGDILFLFSDGMTNKISSDDLLKEIKNIDENNLNFLGCKIAKLNYQRNETDNQTAVIFFNDFRVRKTKYLSKETDKKYTDKTVISRKIKSNFEDNELKNIEITSTKERDEIEKTSKNKKSNKNKEKKDNFEEKKVYKNNKQSDIEDKQG